MNASTSHAQGQFEVRLFIPDLAEEQVLGSGCCFVTLDYLVREELLGWFGVKDVELVPPDEVRVILDARRHPAVEDLVEALLDLGLSEVRAEAPPPPAPPTPVAES